MAKFFGREDELALFQRLKKKKMASLVVVKGRRRAGKSSLAEQAGASFDFFYSFSGLPPTDRASIRGQLEEFSRQISRQFNMPYALYQDWGDAFWAVAKHIKQGNVLLLFDEISWMGSKDPQFLGKLKTAWDQHFKKNDNLVLVICGSASSWIEKNILSHTGFVGRVSHTLTVKELPLRDCAKFWPTKISAYEKFKVLSVTGGIPKYLEEVDAGVSAEENIRRLCFTPGGPLVNEFDHIFSDLFLRNSEYYVKLVKLLVQGSHGQADIRRLIKSEQQGRVSEYLWELEQAGFIERDFTWNIRSAEDSKLSQYRLKDNYLRFYLRYMAKHLKKIQKGDYSLKAVGGLSDFSTVFGLQFENLVLNNSKLLQEVLGVPSHEIAVGNPFFQTATSTSKGCQIDYLIQTRFGSLYVCEIKFSKHPITTEVIKEVEQKISRLSYPKGFSCRPVLIHVNGVTQDVVESNYFAAIVDFADLLN